MGVGRLRMSSIVLQACTGLTLLPFAAIAVMLIFYVVRQIGSRVREPKTGTFRICSTSAFGAVLLFAQMFYRPSFSHVVEIKRDAGRDEDFQGNREGDLGPQLRRLRFGERIDKLFLRL